MTVFTTDLEIQTSFPGLEYSGSETGAVYYEDREVSGVMYRVVNATFNKADGYPLK